jgi:transposase
VARPDKLTPEIQQKIVDSLRMGNYIETASAYAGINKTTLYDWLKRGAREKRGKYKQFSNAVEKAMAEAEMRDVALIAQAAKENWQAAAWRLERKYPARWGRKTQHEVTGKDGKPVEFNAKNKLLEKIEGMLKQDT